MSKKIDVDTVDLKDIISPAKATTQYYKFKITFEKLRKLSSTYTLGFVSLNSQLDCVIIGKCIAFT